MKSMLAVVSLVLFHVGVAQADSPGGWDQFTATMAKARAQQNAAVVQQAPVNNDYAATARSDTRSQANSTHATD
jgi:hypothetical protein